ncbi:MAG TPA: Do family serine endopeptidase [Ignavibacteriaceae bacterium]|nr:Do family serine endopeptidase [Ignavibacteriaceae bacterium]
MKSKRLFGAVALIVVGIVFGAVLVSGFGLVRPGLADVKIGASNPPVNLDADATSFSKSFIEVADKVTPQIVQIEVVSERDNSKNPHSDLFFFPFKDMPKEEKGSGSGIIISPDGYIVTNNHVVENATKVTVGLSDRRTFDAKVIGTDPLTDLAVIKVDANNLPAAYLGDSDALKVGQWVMAIGNPLSLSSTVTAGIVSAKGRGHLGLIKDLYGVEDFIQTDAAINPGNSGGALVDLSGAVVGINSAIASSGTGTYIGYGFAIPINLVKSVVKDLIAHGKVTRGYIGVQISEVNDAIAKSIGLDKPKGVMIQGLVSGGSAESAGIKEGDVILKIDGREVNQSNELQSYIAGKTAGTKVNLTIYRDGEEIEKTVTLKAKEDNKSVQPVVDKNNSDKNNDSKMATASFDDIGLTVKNMQSDEKSEFNVKNGVLITGVKPYSDAADQRLGPNLVIVEANKKKIDNVRELKEAFKSKKGSAVLLKVVDNKGNSVFVGLNIPEDFK